MCFNGRVVYSVVLTRHSNPRISKFSRRCNESNAISNHKELYQPEQIAPFVYDDGK